MNNNLSSAQLKSLSKGQLLGRYGSAIASELTVTSLVFCVSLLCSALTDETSIAGILISCVISFILEILSGIFYVGLARFYLNLVCGRPYSVADVFYGFRCHADKAIALRFFICLIELLCMAPFLLCLFFYSRKESAVLFLCCSILIALGCVVMIYFQLLYSQIYYVMLDFPSFSTKQILNTSRHIMKGQKGRLFYITVTLLPYYLLCFLSCGIALLWVTPYRKAICTNFYLDLMGQNKDSLCAL